MNTILKAGVLLGVLAVAWTFVMGISGWYKDPVLMNLFFAVILIQIAVLIWALRQTAAEGRAYSGQVIAGSALSIVGGIIIIFGSLLFTTVVFPNYFSDLAAIQERMLRDAGKSEAEIRAALDATAKTSTPMLQAIFGFIGTVLTGLVGSLIIGAFVKAKKQPAS